MNFDDDDSIKAKAFRARKGPPDLETDREIFGRVTGGPGVITSYRSGSAFRHHAVTSVRELALAEEPSLHDDLDLLIEQLIELTDRQLRALKSEPNEYCNEFNVQCGKVRPVTIAAVALGELEDRRKDSDRGFQWWLLLIGAGVALVGQLIYFAITGENANG